MINQNKGSIREALDRAVEQFGRAMGRLTRATMTTRDSAQADVDRCRAEVHRLLDEICPKEEEKK